MKSSIVIPKWKLYINFSLQFFHFQQVTLQLPSLSLFPYTLRHQADETYRLVGEAYVQGIIDREAFEEGISVKDWAKVDEEDFVPAWFAC